MKAKQKNIRIFDIEIESDEEFFSYMDKNLILLKEYLLLLRGEVTNEIRAYLDENGVCYKEMKDCNIKLNAKELKSKDAPQKIEIVQYVEVEEEKRLDTKSIYSPVRSGTIVESDGDIVIFGRVNSGAKVICGGNLSVYEQIDGVVECDGEYMILKEIGKGYAIFNGDILEKEEFNGSLKRVTRGEDGPIIKDLT